MPKTILDFLKSPNKKHFLFIAVIILIIFLALFIYFIGKKLEIEEEAIPRERTLEEILKEDLTVPEGVKIEPLSQEILKDLTVPAGVIIEPLSQEVLEDLTAPE